MSIPYETKLPAHVDELVVRELAAAWRAEFDASLAFKAQEEEGHRARWKAEADAKKLLVKAGAKIGDGMTLYHDGETVFVTLKKSTNTYGPVDGEAEFTVLLNGSNSDNRDADTELGKVSSAWLAGKRQEERAKNDGAGLFKRLADIEQKLLKHIVGKLTNDFVGQFYITYLHPDGWACWISAVRPYGLGEWKISVRFSTIVLAAKRGKRS